MLPLPTSQSVREQPADCPSSGGGLPRCALELRDVLGQELGLLGEHAACEGRAGAPCLHACSTTTSGLVAPRPKLKIITFVANIKSKNRLQAISSYDNSMSG